MKSVKQLHAAVPHVANDMLLVRQSNELRRLKVGWTTWYSMARNAAAFFGIVQGDRDDIRATDYFDPGSAELRKWKDAKAEQLKDAPPELATLYSDASRATAHLSWSRVTQPPVQPPSNRITQLLGQLWAGFVASLPAHHKEVFLQEWAELHPAQKRKRGGRSATR